MYSKSPGLCVVAMSSSATVWLEGETKSWGDVSANTIPRHTGQHHSRSASRQAIH